MAPNDEYCRPIVPRLISFPRQFLYWWQPVFFHQMEIIPRKRTKYQPAGTVLSTIKWAVNSLTVRGRVQETATFPFPWRRNPLASSAFLSYKKATKSSTKPSVFVPSYQHSIQHEGTRFLHFVPTYFNIPNFKLK
jgi:hypothetical protein